MVVGNVVQQNKGLVNGNFFSSEVWLSMGMNSVFCTKGIFIIFLPYQTVPWQYYNYSCFPINHVLYFSFFPLIIKLKLTLDLP